jgi:cytosine deaminase
MVLDVIIKNARLRGADGNKDIGVEEGKISKVASEIRGEGRNEINAEGNLVTPGLVNVHLHLDKCLTGEWIRTAIDAKTGSTEIIPLASEAKKKFTENDIVARASRAVEGAISYGTTAIRAFADVDSIGGLTAVKALLNVKKRYDEYLTIQVVAFPQEGIIRDPESKELLSKAIELGGDVVGGMPWYEKSKDDSRRHTDFAFELAKRYNKDIHMLIDDTEDPESKNLSNFLPKGCGKGSWEG